MVLVPGVLALLPEYAGEIDPVPELRAACREAVGWLDGPVEVVAGDDRGRRVAQALLEEARDGRREVSGDGEPTAYLVVGNGSACRTEKAPGHLDERAAGFDTSLGEALASADSAALADLDHDLAEELWASTGAFGRLAELLAAGPEGAVSTTVDYADDPFGVQYWVVRWTTPA
ncbi:hypothetical protein ACFP3Q_02560 [Nocardioides sp. GCM10027113]|uniref:hypothetical protein n=1 Tax=unclassified Nocardioides TaxID=2615069 RepID=UPI003614AD34